MMPLTMSRHVDLILDARNGVGESPVWMPTEQALYWVDIPARTLHRWDAASGQTSYWQVPEMLACIPATQPPEAQGAMQASISGTCQ